MTEIQDERLLGMGLLLQIGRRARQAADPREVGFIAVNETKQVLSYRQGALWLQGKGVYAVSGLPESDPSAPYVQWLARVFPNWRKEQKSRATGPSELPAALGERWGEWLPAHAAVVPLRGKDGSLLGLLLFARDEEWLEGELTLLDELASIYAHALWALAGGKRRGAPRSGVFRGAFKLIPVALAVAALFYPVRLSVLAPAEVTPKDPFVVRSPLDGVIDRFYLHPNQPVRQGDLLFEYDSSALRAKMGVAAKAYEVASEEYRQSVQMALSDDKTRGEMEPRRGKMQEKEAELSYSRQMFHRLQVRAPRSGIAVFTDQSDWVGKNVSVGERVLVIADPARADMLIHLPVADAMNLELGSRVKLYLGTDPQHPVEGTLRYASFKPELNPAGYAAYRLKADFAPGATPPRLGLTGTVRIYGEKVSLGRLIFRRPITALRQRLGW
ncbi:HlyD family efflux transporter periplasmic adaptor subunit [Geomonas terrae]|uniref:HlyD family efflux transporter periplasmic adaptor subunit n=1 Tax=Geomonas terrae TaxID=2562681 RepID=A0A4S1CAV2_9BACT|nr:HlyD family efflux transporter periplasmic adaptor subunit [Geomonas terrae]TGU70439.1 HlyD family efflux transporter periplasmic adaptor subunit [Geomonas terrae]TGU72859.1 HlyD family efflux transporter periplasmic adaptor subunit [Geomonas terrae]